MVEPAPKPTPVGVGAEGALTTATRPSHTTRPTPAKRPTSPRYKLFPGGRGSLATTTATALQPRGATTENTQRANSSANTTSMPRSRRPWTAGARPEPAGGVHPSWNRSAKGRATSGAPEDAGLNGPAGQGQREGVGIGKASPRHTELATLIISTTRYRVLECTRRAMRSVASRLRAALDRRDQRDSVGDPRLRAREWGHRLVGSLMVQPAKALAVQVDQESAVRDRVNSTGVRR